MVLCEALLSAPSATPSSWSGCRVGAGTESCFLLRGQGCLVTMCYAFIRKGSKLISRMWAWA
eukprot:5621370-Amphidinium_carterae.1